MVEPKEKTMSIARQLAPQGVCVFAVLALLGPPAASAQSASTLFESMAVPRVKHVRGTWELTDSMAVPRVFHASARLKTEEVLIVGGLGNDPRGRIVELYDPLSETFSSV